MASYIVVKNDTRNKWLVKIGTDEAAVAIVGHVTTALGLAVGAVGAVASIGPVAARLAANGVVQVFGVSTQAAARVAVAAGSAMAVPSGVASALKHIRSSISFAEGQLKQDGWTELYPGEDHAKHMTLSLWQQCECLRFYTNDEGNLIMETFFMRPIFSGPTHDSRLVHNLQYWLDKNGVTTSTISQNLGRGVAAAYGEKAIQRLGSLNVLDGNGHNLYLHQQNDGRYQRWTLEYHDDGTVSFLHKQSGKALDGNGANLYFHDYNGGDYQRWRFVRQEGTSFFEIYHVKSDKFLSADATNLYFADKAIDSSYWTFIEYSG